MTEGATYDQLRLAGRAVRARVPRSAHEAWQPPDDRPDPIELLEENNLPRLPDLVPVRYGRMLASPFAFLRGSAVIMASDLASTPITGLRVQACGDAHLGNFGVFATPERNLVFDVNDFDETLPGPWEWDLKRLAVSVIVAAGNLQIDAGQAAAFTTATIRAYRERMAELAVMGPLDAWYDRIDVAAVLTIARQRRAKDLQRQLSTAKLRHRTSLHALPKLTTVVNGTRKIIDDPPLIGHFEPEAFDGGKMIAAYAESLPPDRRPLLERYRVLDTARKVVGVGSVGTRCYLSLLTDADARSPVFLQLKEAMEAVLAPYAGKSEFAHAGQRVVVGQRLMQAASDMFLGWTSYRGHDYYVRQFRDMKGSVNLDAMTPSGFATYAEVCGRTMARAHARSGNAATIGGYTGTGTRFDASITSFAQAYGKQVRRDYDALVVAVESGRITAATGLLAAPPRGRGLLRAPPQPRRTGRPAGPATGTEAGCGREMPDSPTASVKALSVHRSTVKYRLNRIRQVSGYDLSLPDNQFNLQLVTRAWRTQPALRRSCPRPRSAMAAGPGNCRNQGCGGGRDHGTCPWWRQDQAGSAWRAGPAHRDAGRRRAGGPVGAAEAMRGAELPGPRSPSRPQGHSADEIVTSLQQANAPNAVPD